jgi:peptidoglycan/LPS O-acetylase OafA/YrhL
MRGFASLGVLVFHTVEAFTGDDTSPTVALIKNLVLTFFCLGMPGMRIPLFFMISGFSNHLKSARTKASGEVYDLEPGEFLKRRVRKLYPSYVVALTISCGIMLAGLIAGHQLMTVENYPGHRYAFLAFDYVAHLLFLHGFISFFDRGAGNGPLWTMAREAQFFLLYIPLHAFRSRFRLRTCVILSFVCCFVSLAVAELLQDSYPHLAYAFGRSGLAYWPYWVLGMAAVEMCYGLAPGRGKIVSPLGFLIAGSIYAGDQLGTSSKPFLNLVLLGVTLFLFVMYLVNTEQAGKWPRVGPIRWFERAGKYSYHLFLIHAPILLLMGRALRNWETSTSVVHLLMACILNIGASIAAAVILKKAMDTAFDRRNRRRNASNDSESASPVSPT